MSSFLTRSLPSRTFAVARAIPRAAAVHTPRAFTTSYPLQKTATETVKDGLKTVDKVVSEKLVDGIDLATAAGNKVKETTENLTQSEVAGKAEELKGEIKGKAEEVQGKAKGTMEQMKGKAKGTAEEMKGQAKGSAEEVKRKL